MSKDAIVSDELAKKFAKEKDTPYLKWVRDEGLDIIDALYVKNLNHVELSPGLVVGVQAFISTMTRLARPTTAMSVRFRPVKN